MTNLKDLIEDQGGRLGMENIEGVDRLIAQGLVAVTFCNHGKARSCEAAQVANRWVCPKAPTLFLEGGMAEMARRCLSDQEVVAGALSRVPYVFGVLEPDEQGDYEAQIRLIQRKKTEGVLVMNRLWSAAISILQSRPGTGKYW